MRKIILAALCGLLLSAPGAEAKTLKVTYSDLYHAVAKKQGKRTPGRNIRRLGVKTKHGVRSATSAELARSIRTFRRWLAPPAVTPAVSDHTPVGSIASVPSQAGGKYAIPRYIVMCESGGDYHKYNSAGSGASGAYQIMPGTWKAYGGSTKNAADASPAEQDRIAGRIYAAEGARPWSCR